MLLRPLAVLLLLFACAIAASAQDAWTFELCYEAQAQPQAVEKAEEIRTAIRSVAGAIGLRDDTIIAIPCQYSQKILAKQIRGDEKVPDGRYIFYDPVWLQEVVGKDQVQLTALVGHELAHFLNGDFDRHVDDAKDVETKADYFAGCAVAKLGGVWPGLESLLERIRREHSDQYPDRLASLDEAKAGFINCGGNVALVVTDKAANCPMDGLTLVDSAISDSNVGLSAPPGYPLCIVGTTFDKNAVAGIQIRDSPGLPGAAGIVIVTPGKFCRVLFRDDVDDPLAVIVKMNDDDTLFSCARRSLKEGGRYAQLGCDEQYFGPIFEALDPSLMKIANQLAPGQDCGWFK